MVSPLFGRAVTEILVRRKKLVRGTKIPGIMVRPDHFPLKNLVRTWNNSLSTSTMFDRNCRLWKGYGSALQVVSSIRQPRYVTTKKKKSPEVVGFPWNKPVVCFNWSTRANAWRCPSRELPNQSEKGSNGSKDVWKCRSSRQGKDFLTCIKCTRDCLSTCETRTKFPGADHFSTENFGPGGPKFSGPKFRWQSNECQFTCRKPRTNGSSGSWTSLIFHI